MYDVDGVNFLCDAMIRNAFDDLVTAEQWITAWENPFQSKTTFALWNEKYNAEDRSAKREAKRGNTEFGVYDVASRDVVKRHELCLSNMYIEYQQALIEKKNVEDFVMSDEFKLWSRMCEPKVFLDAVEKTIRGWKAGKKFTREKRG